MSFCDFLTMGETVKIFEALASVDSPAGRKRVVDFLKTGPYPQYEPAKTPGLVVRIDADGQRTIGRFVKRQFVIVH